MPATLTDAFPPHLLLTPREAAATLAVSARTLWALTHPRGPIHAVRVGRSVRYELEGLRGWIAAGCPRHAAQRNGRG
jgi:excisionase family DNA binding protein